MSSLAFAAPPRVFLRRERRSRRYSRMIPPGLGYALAFALLLGVTMAGAIRGGQYAAFVHEYGDVRDILAGNLGLGISSVTMTGLVHLNRAEVYALAGIHPNSTLPFFNADTAREALLRSPLIARASVRKLYPNRLNIDIVERGPVALWQRDGKVSLVSEDGAALNELKDEKLTALPFVVGEDANKHVPEYLSLLDAAQDIKNDIGAGVYIGQRRWNLHMKTGVDIKLPEDDPAAAVRRLLTLERETHILERAILSLDLRISNRAFARLTAEAEDARAPKKKGGKT